MNWGICLTLDNYEIKQKNTQRRKENLIVQGKKIDNGNNEIFKLNFYTEHVKSKCFNLHKEKRYIRISESS